MKDACSTNYRHTDASTTAIDLAVAVLRGGLFDGESGGVRAVGGKGGRGVRRRGRRYQLEVRLRVVEVVRVVAVGSSCHHRMDGPRLG